MLVTCSIGRTSHQSLILYTVARLDTRWRDIEDGNGLPVTPSSKAASVLPIPSSACSSQISTPTSCPSGLELVWWERIKPPNKVAYRWLLYEAVNTLNKRAYSVTHLGWNATAPPSFPVFLVSVALASYCGLWMLDVASSSFARCCLWTA